jgi:hypothetical protein
VEDVEPRKRVSLLDERHVGTVQRKLNGLFARLFYLLFDACLYVIIYFLRVFIICCVLLLFIICYLLCCVGLCCFDVFLSMTSGQHNHEQISHRTHTLYGAVILRVGQFCLGGFNVADSISRHCEEVDLQCKLGWN